MQTCRHFRNRIPAADADTLRAADPNPCELCDRQTAAAAVQNIEWEPLHHQPQSLTISCCLQAVGQMLQSSWHLRGNPFLKAVASRMMPQLRRIEAASR